MNDISDPMQLLTKPWQKFFQKFEEIETVSVSEWREYHVLGYICKKYEEKFNKKFNITIKNAPSKSPDIYLIKRIFASLNTVNTKVVKEYIDWVFENKTSKRPFNKLSYFLAQGFANEFYSARIAKANNWDRSSTLPESYKSMAKELDISVNTYGDLAFVNMAAERSQDKTSPYYVLIKNLELIGLDLNRLKTLK